MNQGTGYNSVVEHLSNIHKARGSISSTTTKKKKKRTRKKERKNKKFNRRLILFFGIVFPMNLQWDTMHFSLNFLSKIIKGAIKKKSPRWVANYQRWTVLFYFPPFLEADPKGLEPNSSHFWFTLKEGQSLQI